MVAAPGDTPTGPGVDRLTVVGAAVLAACLGIMAHQLAHLVVGRALGGVFTVLTATGFDGHWSTMRTGGRVLLGASGPLAQAAVALAGWLLYRRGIGEPGTTTLFGWLLFVINAWVPTLQLVGGPVLATGDWMFVLDRIPALGPARVSAAVTGLFVGGQLWQATANSLARLVGNGSGTLRTALAQEITRTAWLATVALGLALALVGPGGARAGLPAAAAMTFGGAWPMVLAPVRVRGTPVPGRALAVPRSPALLAAAFVAAMLVVGLLGPGVPAG